MKQVQKLQYHPKNSCQLQKYRVLFLVGILNLMAKSVQADNYLKEAPAFLQPCKINDSKNNECVAKAFENIFTNWREGITGLKTLGNIDPFLVKKVHLEQTNPNINIKFDAKDLVVTGLSETRITKANINNEYDFKFLLKIPKLSFKNVYRLKGTILLLNLNSTGPMHAEASDLEIGLSIKMQLTKVKNQKFFEIISLQSHIKKIGNFNIQFGNLFNGNTELEDSANAVFNQNWQQLFEIMRPVLEETLAMFITDHCKMIFSFVPANYFFDDLP